METSVEDDTKDGQATEFCQTTLDLQKVLEVSTENVLERVTDEVFISLYKECYQGFEKLDEIVKPSLSGSSAEARKYRKQFIALVKQSALETISETLLSTVDNKLKKLEELKQEQTDSSFVWRPPGNAIEHMIPFTTVSKMEEKREIENLIEKEREAISLLKSRLIQKRLKARELYAALQDTLKNIENAVTIQPLKGDKNHSEMETGHIEMPL